MAITDYREMIRLQDAGHLRRKIAELTGCAESTVYRVLDHAEAQNLTWHDAKTMTNEQIREVIYPSGGRDEKFAMPDYALVARELHKQGVTRSLLWKEYCENCDKEGLIPYGFTQFCKYFREYSAKRKVTMHLEHKPGEEVQVDWAGQSLPLHDPLTGKDTKTYLFVACLPFSGFMYAEAFRDMKETSWIAAHVHMFEAFGGVTRLLVPDNLKTGIDRNTRDELVVNRDYKQFAEYYGTAVLPARPRAPRDKAAAENAVGIATTWIVAALRNETYETLSALNLAIMDCLERINDKPFQKREGNRSSVFENEEKPCLLPLPEEPYDPGVWKITKVAPNYCVTIEGNHYSVPYEYAGQKVDVRVKRDTIEVFYESVLIASHRKQIGACHQYTILEKHMPVSHRHYLQWDAERFEDWASGLGEATRIVVGRFLAAGPVERVGLKACTSLKKLADLAGDAHLEEACKLALECSLEPSIKQIRELVKTCAKPVDKPTADTSVGFVRGSDYYGMEEAKRDADR